MNISRVVDLSREERAAIQALASTVYPPDEWTDWPGRSIEWADAEWCVRVHDTDGMLVSYTGMVIREVVVDGKRQHIGGLGGIKTHPAARGRGYARQSIAAALRFFGEQPEITFALLVCEPHLMPFYSALGWTPFDGRLLVRQHGATAEFTFNRAMTHHGPTAGTIDLCGPPW